VSCLTEPQAEHFDMNSFQQILELDDGDSRDPDCFSRGIVFEFFAQTESTIVSIEEYL
jgi:hypothetical protein